MNTHFSYPVIKEASEQAIDEAVALLKKGRLVAFPTETVYGLGADATNDAATASIFAAKGRPSFNPLIIHFPDATSAHDFVHWNEKAEQLAERFWPGPLTLILPRRENCGLSLLASAGLNTVALRVPEHPIAHELLAKVGLPLAAPSANASGKLSPTTPTHVAESLGNNVDMILAGGRCKIGVESSVLDLSTPVPTLLRPGYITQESIEALIGSIQVGAPLAPHDGEALKSPGLLTSHYAPRLPVRLNATQAENNEAFLCFGPDLLARGGALRLNLSPSGDLIEAAANLFAMLRQLDQSHLKDIAVMPIPKSGLGAAINDRLARAAAPRAS